MYYIIYKTINIINGRYYIGKRKTPYADGGSYLGSGKALKEAIKKYGREAFRKEILHYCSSFEEMNALERQIINEDVLADALSYNMKIGGTGGRGRGFTHSKETRDKISVAGLGRIVTQEQREQKSKDMKGRVNIGLKPWNTGGTIPNHQKSIISNRLKGTIFITDGVSTKRIHPTDEMPEGWRKGRAYKSGFALGR